MKCSEPNCNGRAYAGRSHKMCDRCFRAKYLREWRRKRVARGVKCSVPGCVRNAYCKGRCEACYQRTRRNDTNAPTCSVPGCTRTMYRRRDGVCNACSVYHRRHGVYMTKGGAR